MLSCTPKQYTLASCATFSIAACSLWPPAPLKVPHGATQDSGFVAAAAYSLLRSQLTSYGKQGQPRLRCIILGTNRFTNSPLACLSTAATWRTPLGDVPLDAQLNAALAEQGLPYDDAPHKWVCTGRCSG